MSLTLTEKLDSRKCAGENASVKMVYVLTGTSDNLTPKAMAKRPVAVYVEKVYEEGDFAGLRIGA